MRDRIFTACEPEFVRRAVGRALAFMRLNAVAEKDVLLALDRVSPAGQCLFIDAAADARLADDLAVERLSCLWVMAAAVNLADDLADGDCDYVPARVGPGVSFLLQAFAQMLAARSAVSLAGLERMSLSLAHAAAGQSIEVRTSAWNVDTYWEVAGLIGGRQYEAHLGFLWDGTPLERQAGDLGLAIGTAGLVLTDVDSGDRRFAAMEAAEQRDVLGRCHHILANLDRNSHLVSVARFCDLARSILPPDGQSEGHPSLM